MANSIVADKFQEWTKGLGPVESRIALFNHLRDIPYMAIQELSNPVTGPAGLLKQNQGSCSPKHYLLAEYFKQLSIPVKYCTYIFSWKKSLLKWPQEIKDLAEQLPEKLSHLALKANLNNQWVAVDATWDPPLKKAGFLVNENWDGLSNTKNAVVPSEEFDHDTLEERVQFQNAFIKSYTSEELNTVLNFYNALNKWFQQLRN